MLRRGASVGLLPTRPKMTPHDGNHSFLQVGITGGIGTGKSTVCKLFAEKGRTVVSADEIARELTEKDPAIIQAIREVFGERVFGKDGSLDRRQLAGVVFSDDSMLRILNSIVHPRVFEEISLRLSSLPPGKLHPYVLIEAALIYESGMDEWLDYVIVVSADETNCIARVKERDGLTGEEIQSRMRSQMPMSEKQDLADFVIDNNGPAAALTPKVHFLDILFSTMKPQLRQ